MAAPFLGRLTFFTKTTYQSLKASQLGPEGPIPGKHRDFRTQSSELAPMLKRQGDCRPRGFGLVNWTALIASLLILYFVTSQEFLHRSFAETRGNTMTSLKIVQRLSRPPNVTGLVWSPDGSKLATFSDFNSIVTIWDASDWHMIREFQRYSAGYVGNSFAWMPNGLLLTPAAAKTNDQTQFSLSLWDPDTGTLVKNIPGPTDEQDVKQHAAALFAVSKDFAAVVLGDFHVQNRVFLFDTQNWSIKATLTFNEVPTAVAFGLPNRLAVGTAGGHLKILEMPQDAAEQTILAFQRNRNVMSSAFSPNGALLAATPTVGFSVVPLDDGPVRIWKVDTGERVATLGSVQDNQTFPQVAWSADGTLLAAISLSGLLEVWRVGATQSSVFTTHFSAAGYAAAFAPSGALAAAVGAEVVILK